MGRKDADPRQIDPGKPHQNAFGFLHQGHVAQVHFDLFRALAEIPVGDGGDDQRGLPPEHARDVARDIAKTDTYQQSRKDRKKVEVLFAHMKRILKVDRLRLRGLTGAKDEFLLTATVQNLRRMAKYLGTGPPASLMSAVR